MLNISENHLRAFSSLAHVVERKLLEMQMALIAHQHQIRFAHIKFPKKISVEETKSIEAAINNMYDLLEKFCSDYDIPVEEANLKNELAVKANFLWEDISGAATKGLRGYGTLNEDIKNDYELKVTEMMDAANKLIKSFK
jgi:hypothetical protein